MQYKDSAYVNVGGLPPNLTEGDVITIFSQCASLSLPPLSLSLLPLADSRSYPDRYGEVVDINMPRDPQTGKPRGFAWLMYADQRSTVLAVDNLNGAAVLGRTLRVDHVLNYKQLERDQESGKMKEREERRSVPSLPPSSSRPFFHLVSPADLPPRSLAAHPDKFRAPASDASDADSDSSHPSIDLDDPMRDYLIEQRRTAKKRRIESGGGGGGGTKEDKEEKRRRKEERRRKREERERRRAGGGGKKAVTEGRSEHERAGASSRDDAGRRNERGASRDVGRRRDERDAHERRRGADDGERERERRRRDDEGDRYGDRRRERDDEYRRRDERDERRGEGRSKGASGGMGAYADLERLVRGG